MLTALSQSPATSKKRMGDGFYEQKLVREQVQALTGQRYLGDYRSDQAEYQALMDNGLTYAKQWNLRPGIALTPEQVAQLTSDMVWLVSQDVTLADGSKQSVLVPQVYVRVSVGPNMLDGKYALAKAVAGNAMNKGAASDNNSDIAIYSICCGRRDVIGSLESNWHLVGSRNMRKTLLIIFMCSWLGGC